MRSLLDQQGTDVNAKDKKGQTALHIAATGGHSQFVQTLLNNHAEIEAEDNGDNGGQTALHRAAAFGKWAVLRILLENGANQNAEDDLQRTPIYIAEHAAQTIDYEVCVWIFDHGHHINARDDHQDTLLLHAVHKVFHPSVDNLLKSGADIEETGRDGTPPLIVAAAQGSTSIARLLLDKGAKDEATDRNSSTALIRAARGGHDEAMRALLDHGANIEAKNSNEDTPLSVAAYYNHATTVQSLLKAKPRDAGHILYKTSERGRAKVADILVKAGADSEWTTGNGTTALMIAAGVARWLPYRCCWTTVQIPR